MRASHNPKLREVNAHGSGSLLETNVFKGSLVSFVSGVLLLILPYVINIAERRIEPKYHKDLKDVYQILTQILAVSAAGGASTSIIDRVKDQRLVYTPKNIIGPDADDVV
jgi:hypothetical protein